VTVLDSSAVLAVAFGETGASAVLSVAPSALLSAANLAEVLTVAERKNVDSDKVFHEILGLGVTIVPVTDSQAIMAAKLWLLARSLNLSLGDRICLALAIERNVEVLTSDREMTRIAVAVPVTLFR